MNNNSSEVLGPRRAAPLPSSILDIRECPCEIEIGMTPSSMDTEAGYNHDAGVPPSIERDGGGSETGAGSSGERWCGARFVGPNPMMARYVYALTFLVTNILAWTARECYGHSALAELHRFEQFCHGARYCFGAVGVLRISLGCFYSRLPLTTYDLSQLFFFVMFMSTVNTRKVHDSRNSWHSKWWPAKIALWMGCMALPFFVPLPLVLLYANVAHIGAGAFLVIQLISVTRFIEWLNDYCRSEINQRRCHMQIIVVSIAAYVGSILGVVLMYVWYAPSPTCKLNIIFITVTLVLVHLMTFVSMSSKVNTGYLAPGLMGVYVVFLCWSAIRSEPHTEICNKKAAVATSADWVNIASFVIAVIVIIMATFSTGIDSKCLHFNNTEADSEEDDIPYGFGFFHFIFAMGAMYFAMIFVGWNAHLTMDKWTIDVGWASTWVRVVNEWLAGVVYVWMMLAPVVLKSRQGVGSST